MFFYASAIVFLVAYLMGSIPFGFLICMYNGVDIRTKGSHNIGATNVTRVMGSTYGRLCFALDFLKGLFAVVCVGGPLGRALGVGTDWGCIVGAAAAVVGHIYPFWLGFKGGKGVATSIGVLFGLAIWPVIIALLVWYAVYRKTLIVSVASLATAAAAPLAAVLVRWLGIERISWHAILLMFILGGLIWWRHRENIVRLIHGEENAFRKK